MNSNYTCTISIARACRVYAVQLCDPHSLALPKPSCNFLMHDLRIQIHTRGTNCQTPSIPRLLTNPHWLRIPIQRVAFDPRKIAAVYTQKAFRSQCRAGLTLFYARRCCSEDFKVRLGARAYRERVLGPLQKLRRPGSGEGRRGGMLRELLAPWLHGWFGCEL